MGQTGVGIVDWETLKLKASELLSSLHMIFNQTVTSATNKADGRKHNVQPGLTWDNVRLKYAEAAAAAAASIAPHKSNNNTSTIAPASSATGIIPPDYESETRKATADQVADYANVRDC